LLQLKALDQHASILGLPSKAVFNQHITAMIDHCDSSSFANLQEDEAVVLLEDFLYFCSTDPEVSQANQLGSIIQRYPQQNCCPQHAQLPPTPC
jgi:hypothetical protein